MSSRAHLGRAVTAFGLLLVFAFSIGLGQDEKKELKFPPFGKGPGGPMGQVRQLVKDFDKDGDGRLNTEERKAARETAKKGGGFGKGGFGPGKGGFGPGGFRSGGFMAKPFLETLDADKDGMLTKEELAAGVKKFLAENDKEKKGALDESQLGEGFERILPRPKGFPGEPPGKGPGGPPKFAFAPSGPLATAVLKRADANKDGKVTREELLAGAEAAFKEADKSKDGKLDEMELGAGIGDLLPPPPFGPGGFGKDKRDPPKPGPLVTPAEVRNFPDSSLYEPTVLRTLFLEFESKDWEAELADFYKTDVEVPVTLIVDGKKYPNVGVHFRGMSSYFGVPTGYKHSLNLSLDFANPKQKLYGYRTLNLLNANGDPSLMSTVLYSRIAREHIPAPKANFVKVVINGESWGIYSNVQQFNKEFLTENFKTSKGARWKVSGSPGGDGGLSYVGENIEDYKRRYQIKSEDKDKDWKALIELCRVLGKTPANELEKALTPLLDIDGALWFLALDIALMNGDGYWIRASDFSIFRDPKGKFHIVPHDMNEAFTPGFGGPGFGKGPGKGFGPGKEPGPGKGPGPDKEAGPRGSGIEVDPLIGLEDARKPLRGRLLAVPKFRAKYLEYVRTIAERDLDWKKLGPIVAQHRALIEKEVEADTRKLSSLDSFKSAVADIVEAAEPKGLRGRMSLRAFAEQRGTFLLNHPEIKKGAGSE